MDDEPSPSSDTFDADEIAENIIEKQQNDSFCKAMMDYLLLNELPPDKKMAQEILILSRYMVVANGLLIHFWTTISEKRRSQSIKQLVIPTSLQNHVRQYAHCDKHLSAHWGVTKSFKRLRLKFFWKGMYSDLLEFIRKCDHCQRKKNPTGHLRIKTPYVARPNPVKPWDVLSTDVMQLPLSRNAFKWVLIVVDNFSRYIEAVPLNTVNGQSVGNMLMTHIICKHGCPSVLICDNASYNAGGDFPKLCKSLMIYMTPVPSYTRKQMELQNSK